MRYAASTFAERANAIAWIAPTWENAGVTFGELRTSIFRAYAERQYDGALQQLDAEWSNHADRIGDLSYWRICLLSLLGRVDEALDTVSSSLDSGLSFPPTMLGNDPDLESLRQDSRFGAISDRLSDIHKLRIAEGRPRIEFVLPAVSDVVGPALLLFHGNNSNGHAALAQWQPVVPKSCLLAAVTAREPSHATDSYLWSEPAARQLTLEATVPVFESLTRDRLLGLCGFSLGCTAAIEAAQVLSREVHLMWLAAPSVSTKRLELLDPFPPIRHLVVFAGEHDQRALEAGDTITKMATEAGSIASLVVVENLAHEFPSVDIVANAIKQSLHPKGS